MRRLIAFDCVGAEAGATLDDASGATGILFVSGGSQTRVGSHRMAGRLAAALSDHGYPCFRFDRRGVGDSAGEDPGFRGASQDIAAAAFAFRREAPQVEHMFGLGLCDGAAALALFGAQAGLSGLVLLNPWMVEAEENDPAPAAIRAHYRDRLLSLDGWKRLLTGGVSLGKLLGGLRKAAHSTGSPLAAEIAASLRDSDLPAEVILARGDATAAAASAELKAPTFKHLVGDVQIVSSDSHTFARPGDEALLAAAAVTAIRRLEEQVLQ